MPLKRHFPNKVVLPMFSLLHLQCSFKVLCTSYPALTERKVNTQSIFFNSYLQIKAEIMLRVFKTHLIMWWLNGPITFSKKRIQKLECWELKILGLVCFKKVRESLLEYMNPTLYPRKRGGFSIDLVFLWNFLIKMSFNFQTISFNKGKGTNVVRGIIVSVWTIVYRKIYWSITLFWDIFLSKIFNF